MKCKFQGEFCSRMLSKPKSFPSLLEDVLRWGGKQPHLQTLRYDESPLDVSRGLCSVLLELIMTTCFHYRSLELWEGFFWRFIIGLHLKIVIKWWGLAYKSIALLKPIKRLNHVHFPDKCKNVRTTANRDNTFKNKLLNLKISFPEA